MPTTSLVGPPRFGHTSRGRAVPVIDGRRFHARLKQASRREMVEEQLVG
jgi:hypothetical protein